MRHTLQTFITLSHWFLIFVNKREKLGEDERTGAEGDGGRDTLDVGGRDALGAGGRGTEALVLLSLCKKMHKYTKTQTKMYKYTMWARARF